MDASETDAAWLQQDRSLEQLQDRFPEDWQQVRDRLIAASGQGQAGVHRLLAEYRPRRGGPRDRAATRAVELRLRVQRRMLQQVLQSWSDRTESGVEEGSIRFRRFDGAILQRVLFRQGLERKPVRMLPFAVAWRLARQRNRLMPLVRQRGIYCFYSRPLLTRIARIAAGRPVLEIGAGDGTLTRMLRQVGVDAHAADDYSWAAYIDYPDWVERAGARTALERHRPEVVVCSWPPSDNTFERHVFAAPSVRTYIAILSSDPNEAGSPHAYRSQAAFVAQSDPQLDRLVLPPGRNRVQMFQRVQ